MARLHEYQGKALLKQAGIAVPRGGAVDSVDAARALAADIGGPVVVKAQAWVTGRAGLDLVCFADTPDDAASAAGDLLGRAVGSFRVEQVLVEERLALAQEFYIGVIVDDSARAPVVIFSSMGGSGVEEIARTHPDRVARHAVDVVTGLRGFEARDLIARTGVTGKPMLQLADLAVKFYDVARHYEARSAEINPLALTADGRLVALDARFTIDDYAVFRHPELGIEIAREFDRPPTVLERIAWDVEKHDYRGTFYFIQMETDFAKGDGVIGFHGTGGGGAMMNMDALLGAGFRIANFTDTSGNPPASKVYRAARIILSQPGLDGYYAGGSGVASQEQFHSARGLVKAFMDAGLNVPAVLRVGGNGEEQAIDILHRANSVLAAPVEAYGRDDTPDFCVQRLRERVDSFVPVAAVPVRDAPTPQEPYTFATVTGGTVMLDHAACRDCESKACISTCAPGILSLDGDVPVLNISRDDAARGGCTECLACEVECYFLGNRGGRVILPVEGLEAYGDSD